MGKGFKRVDWRKVQTEDPFEQMLIESAQAGLVMLGYQDGKLAAKITEHGKEYVENEMLAYDADMVYAAFEELHPDKVFDTESRRHVKTAAADIAQSANKYDVDLRPTVVKCLLQALLE